MQTEEATMRRPLFFTVLCLAAALLAGCFGSSGRQPLMKLAPEGSYAVIALDWKVVSRDSDLRRVVKTSEAEQIFARLDVDPAEVSELVVFSDASGPDSASGSTGMIVRGSFDKDDVVGGLKRRGWTAESYEGRKLYTNPADGTRVAVLRKNALVLGTRAGVEGTIRADLDPEAGFGETDAYRKLSRRVTGERYPVAMIVAIPQGTQDMAATALEVSATVMDMAGFGPLGELLNKIGYARGLSCTIARKGDAFPVEVTAIMKDEDAATFVSGALNLMKRIPSMLPRQNMSPSDRRAVQELEDISVTRARDVLSIKLVVPRREMMQGL